MRRSFPIKLHNHRHTRQKNSPATLPIVYVVRMSLTGTVLGALECGCCGSCRGLLLSRLVQWD